jgi:hypothetical protein
LSAEWSKYLEGASTKFNTLKAGDGYVVEDTGHL